MEDIDEELKREEKRHQKAKRNMYDYKEMYGQLYYTDVPKYKQIKGISGAALTQVNRDKTIILVDILKEQPYQELLGELQFSFVTFLLGENLDSFEQWKALITLLSHCSEGLATHCDLFFKLIPVIYSQLEQLPEDFFSAEMTQDNFISTCMKDFILECEHGGVDKRLQLRVNKLKTFLIEKFKWAPAKTEEQRLVEKLEGVQLESESDDELP